MKKLQRMVLLLCVACLLSTLAFAQTTQSRLRIGYIEGEPYAEFSYRLGVISGGLRTEGVFSPQLPELSGERDSARIWQEMCRAQQRPDLYFDPTAFYCLSQMTPTQIAKMDNRDDIDLYLVMGTVAGVHLVSTDATNDFMVFASADPVSAGIVQSAEESGRLNRFAHVDRTRYQRQLQVVHNLLDFQDIGVVYQNTDTAYSYSGIAQLETAAALLGFRIHTLHVREPDSPADRERYYTELKQAYHQLIPQIDSLYITTAAIEDSRLPWLLEEVHQAGIATISQTGSSQVEQGALLGVSASDAFEEGMFYAHQLLSYLNGTPLVELNQSFESTPKIALNYDTSRQIGIEIPFRTMLIVDQLYLRDSKP